MSTRRSVLATQSMSGNDSSRPLSILQVLRAPVGGLFRHVCDLTAGLAARGHRVGIVCDSTSGGAAAEQKLADLEAACRLGVHRLPMSRLPGLDDLAATRQVGRLATACGANVLHGHGAKGGAYARLCSANGAARLYTPHGGTLHYSRASPSGAAFLMLERLLARRSSALIFESAYARDTFISKAGKPACPLAVVHNGLAKDEFVPIAPAPREFDLLFVGELRVLKGVSVLLKALSQLSAEGLTLKTLCVGDGPDRATFVTEAQTLGLAGRVAFPGAAPARAQFARARAIVVPSLAESLPYVVLEAGAAALPVIATNVGGIPEIFGDRRDRLVPAGDAAALAAAIRRVIEHPQDALRDAERLRSRLQQLFSIDTMVDRIEALYRNVL